MTNVPSYESAVRLLVRVEEIRKRVAAQLDSKRQRTFGQFFTPVSIAEQMASFSQLHRDRVRLLDAGAGVGVLTAAYVSKVVSDASPIRSIDATAFEVDPTLHGPLSEVLNLCAEYSRRFGVEFSFNIRSEDFIEAAVAGLEPGFFGTEWGTFDAAILNPPYGKFRTDSRERQSLARLGIATGNYYTGFVSLALRSLTPGGELIAITPRSFCNGPYFTWFRRDLLQHGSLTHLHLLDSRNLAFSESAVLQENVIFRVESRTAQSDFVQVEWSPDGSSRDVDRRLVPFDQVVRPDDPDSFIHITPDEWQSRVAAIVRGLSGTLPSLGVEVSTGRVVDFRAKSALQQQLREGGVPLIYPHHLRDGRVVWPKSDSSKPNAIALAEDTRSLVNPSGTYVLVKRFSSKEERRRVTATVLADVDLRNAEYVAFENHLNYFHCRFGGLSPRIARGLAGYLNSSIVDSYFRQFNGHTQVNATDLRKLPYPTKDQLERIADALNDTYRSQAELDDIVENELIAPDQMTIGKKVGARRIAEAMSVLESLGLPKEQTNERAALVLLALIDLPPQRKWKDATAPLRGVTPMMEFAAKHYGKNWKPNTRETVRRHTLHQFEEAGLIVSNPDNPDRPTNSPAYCYQIPDAALRLLRAFGSPSWNLALRRHLAAVPTLKAKYSQARTSRSIPLQVREGTEIKLSPGGQNNLMRDVVTHFCSHFTPGGTAIYVGDTKKKWGYFDDDALAKLGVSVKTHGKMPDVVIHDKRRNWLVLVEAVTSHGPISPKRLTELKKLFADSSAPLVFVTAFPDRRTMNRYLAEIAWETEVWVATDATHMIHFNGERFLGPYNPAT